MFCLHRNTPYNSYPVSSLCEAENQPSNLMPRYLLQPAVRSQKHSGSEFWSTEEINSRADALSLRPIPWASDFREHARSQKRVRLEGRWWRRTDFGSYWKLINLTWPFPGTVRHNRLLVIIDSGEPPKWFKENTAGLCNSSCLLWIINYF